MQIYIIWVWNVTSLQIHACPLLIDLKTQPSNIYTLFESLRKGLSTAYNITLSDHSSSKSNVFEHCMCIPKRAKMLQYTESMQYKFLYLMQGLSFVHVLYRNDQMHDQDWSLEIRFVLARCVWSPQFWDIEKVISILR